MTSGANIWDFAQRAYASPGFAPTAIRLQDAAGVDVCIILVVLWFAANGRRLGATDVAQLEAEAAPWRRDVIEPLRAARRAMKGKAGAETLREGVRSLEIEAERGLLERLAALPLGAQGVPDAAATLRAYAALIGTEFSAADLVALSPSIA